MENTLKFIEEMLKLAKSNNYKIAEREVSVNILFESLSDSLNEQNILNGYEKAIKLNEFKYNIQSIIEGEK